MDQVQPKDSIFKTEPAFVVSTITAALTAVIGALVAFGLDLSDEQQKAVIGCVAPLVGVIFFLGPVIRNFVYSPHSTQKLVNAAESAGAKGETPPVTPV
jgi:hypothetical protein